jgi:hypothetical protein
MLSKHMILESFSLIWREKNFELLANLVSALKILIPPLCKTNNNKHTLTFDRKSIDLQLAELEASLSAFCQSDVVALWALFPGPEAIASPADEGLLVRSGSRRVLNRVTEHVVILKSHTQVGNHLTHRNRAPVQAANCYQIYKKV